VLQVRVISFDLEGTLVDMVFSDKVWNEGVPRLFALKNGLSFEEAKRIVMNEYARIGENRVEWYDIAYWFKRFGLSGLESLLEEYKGYIRFFPEVKEVLDELSGKFTLVLATNSNRLFIKALAKEITHYFRQIFSATSDFKLLKGNSEFYSRVCGILKVRPEEVVHVGDRWVDDFQSPRSIGIRAYLLDRNGKMGHMGLKGSVIADLRELAKIVMADF